MARDESFEDRAIRAVTPPAGGMVLGGIILSAYLDKDGDRKWQSVEFGDIPVDGLVGLMAIAQTFYTVNAAMEIEEGEMS